MFKTILLPTDGSPLSDKAIATALEFARFTGAKLIGICVVQPLPFTAIADTGISVDGSNYEQEIRLASQQHIEQLAESARAANVPFEGAVIFGASPYDEIVKAVEQFNCDMIIMATHGRTGLNKLFLGSETDKVLANTTVPVLVVR